MMNFTWQIRVIGVLEIIGALFFLLIMIYNAKNIPSVIFEKSYWGVMTNGLLVLLLFTDGRLLVSGARRDGDQRDKETGAGK